MSEGESFFDTSVLLYLLSSEDDKADRVEALLEQPGVISVQVLNEFTSVACRKLSMSFGEIREILDTVRVVCRTEALTVEDHERAMQIAERYRFSFYDALIIASALRAECKTLYSEDLQHRQIIERQLRVINPFVKSGSE
jgi:predicted nucleic acid-binding protein